MFDCKVKGLSFSPVYQTGWVDDLWLSVKDYTKTTFMTPQINPIFSGGSTNAGLKGIGSKGQGCINSHNRTIGDKEEKLKKEIENYIEKFCRL